jgi:YVTN family beta-propeller protein
MNRRKVTTLAALCATFFILIGSQSAQAAIVGNTSIVLNHASDWVVSLDVTPDDRYVFVTNYTDGSLSRFDSTDSTIVNTAVCSHPYGVSISPDGATAVVACSGNNALVFVDTQTLTFSQGPGGNTPIGVTYNHAGTRIYSTEEMADNVREMSVSNHLASTTVSVAGSGAQNPFYIAISPDDTKAYVSNFSGDNVSEIDLGTHTVTRTFTGFNHPLGLAVSADGNSLWVANSSPSANTVSLVDLDSGTITQTVTVGMGPREIALSPDGTQLAVANGAESTISLVDTASHAVTSTQNVGDPTTSTNGGIAGAWGIKYSHDGSKIYVANEYNGSLQTLTLDPALAPEPQNAADGGAVEKLANTGGPNWMSLGALGVLLSVAGALTLSATRRRTR